MTIPFDRTGFNIYNGDIDDAQNVVQKNEQIKVLIRANNRITRKEIANRLGVSVKTVARVSKESSTIHYVEFSKIGHWEIEEKNLNFLLKLVLFSVCITCFEGIISVDLRY